MEAVQPVVSEMGSTDIWVLLASFFHTGWPK